MFYLLKEEESSRVFPFLLMLVQTVQITYLCFNWNIYSAWTYPNWDQQIYQYLGYSIITYALQ